MFKLKLAAILVGLSLVSRANASKSVDVLLWLDGGSGNEIYETFTGKKASSVVPSSNIFFIVLPLEHALQIRNKTFQALATGSPLKLTQAEADSIVGALVAKQIGPAIPHAKTEVSLKG